MEASVYTITAPNGTLLYVGCSINVKRRVQVHARKDDRQPANNLDGLRGECVKYFEDRFLASQGA